MRRVRKILLWGAIALLLLVSGGTGLLLIGGKTEVGRTWIMRLTQRLTGGYVTISGLGGDWPSQLIASHLELRDAKGVWLSADHIALTWHPLALLAHHVQVDSLEVESLQIERLPVSSGTQATHPPNIPRIDVASCTIRALHLQPALAGASALLSATGRVTLHSIEDEIIVADLRRLDGDGLYNVNLRFDADRLDASLVAQEPASGPLENILGVPGLGALSARINLHGPRRAAVMDATIDAGTLRARAAGSVDLKAGAVDMRFSVHAPALRPRADLAWERADLEGSWRGDLRTPEALGHLTVAALQLPGQFELGAVTAELSATQGAVAMHAMVTGVRIPGSKPQLLQADPVTVAATLDLHDATRPLGATLAARLFDLQIKGEAAGHPHYAVELRLRDLTPLAAMAGLELGGSALLRADLVPGTEGILVTLDGGGTVAARAPGLAALLGERPTLTLQGEVGREAITIDRLRLTGRAAVASLTEASIAFAAAGGAPGREPLRGRWEASVTDLSVLSPALAGRLDAAGHIAGAPQALAADAQATASVSVHGSPAGRLTARLQIRDLPGKPAGALQASGMLDGAPLQLDLESTRPASGAWHLSVRKADWKSVHAEGEAVLGGAALGDAAARGATRSSGQLRMRVTDLADLGHLLGTNLKGGVEAALDLVQEQGPTQMKLSVAAHEVSVGAFSGNLQIVGAGPFDAIDLQLSAQAPAWRGAPADLKMHAAVNLGAQRLRLATGALSYRGETLRLTAPAQITYGDGLGVDRLLLGAQGAELDLGGRLTPTLDLHVQLRGLGPPLINAFVPDLLASGVLGGQGELHGSLQNPVGRLQLDATGLRFREDTASSLPALALHLTSDFEGDTAKIDGRLSAGSGSLLNVAGDIPLDAAGIADLSIDGNVDLALASPFLEARGQQVAGRVRIDMHLAGTMAAPDLAGTIGLSHGQWRDFSRGISVGDVDAVVAGSGGAFVIKSFTGRAASGQVGLAGSLGLLQPGIPVDLHLTAKDAEPIASSIVTANLDADVRIKGTARERLDVTGTVDLHRTVIGIPNGLPPDVAVLDVRRRGQALPQKEQKLVIGLDLSLRAPQEMLVQGRGLDAELGGEVHLGGTSDAPQVSGGFDLQRGSFSLAGNKLTFTSGRVGFEGAGLRKQIDPTLDFTANSVVNDVTVVLRVTGQADAPQFEFSSVPSLPQDDIMARLFFGEQGAQLTALQAAQIGAALATLSGVGGGSLNPLVKLQRTLGLDRLSVGAASGTAATPGSTAATGASLAAGRYLSKRVYLEAKQSTTGSTQVQVDVDITKHLKVQTRLGNGTAIAQGTTPDNDPGSSVGLSYQFEY